ncbi:MAG: SDR family oxidoreductase [Magnetococcales bacterium]|nr:SDR family oxidoreductase [Magnetococcales bacterium]
MSDDSRRQARFEVEVAPDDAQAFARLSGDWNPLHTDPAYAAATAHGRPILHGAFSAGLVSRMAGMFLPGRACLLRSLRLSFHHPILPPARLEVAGRVVAWDGVTGRGEVEIRDLGTAQLCVTASYEYGLHAHDDAGAAVAAISPGASSEASESSAPPLGEPRVLVTGATGGLGSAVLRRLGRRGVGLSRQPREGMVQIEDPVRLDQQRFPFPLAGIVHGAWPPPDNDGLLALAAPEAAVHRHVADPLEQMLALARLLKDQGIPDAPLILVGSTFAEPGRHAFRTPLYSLSKAMIPSLTTILALELARHRRRCLAVVLDVLDGGMNADLNPRVRLAHANRSPFGLVPTPDEVAGQILWLLDNPSPLASGGVFTLTGNTLP